MNKIDSAPIQRSLPATFGGGAMIGALGGKGGIGKRAGLHAGEVKETGVESAGTPRFVEAETIGCPDEHRVHWIIVRFVGDERGRGPVGDERKH